jgi:hypothetical protein
LTRPPRICDNERSDGSAASAGRCGAAILIAAPQRPSRRPGHFILGGWP